MIGLTAAAILGGTQLLGSLGSTGMAFAQQNKAQERMDEYQKSIEEARLDAQGRLNAQQTRNRGIMQNNTLNSMYGISPTNESLMAGQTKYTFAYGGFNDLLEGLFAYGGITNNNGSEAPVEDVVANGGTHGTNPFGGVPFEITPGGYKTMEEGEVRVDLGGTEYIFSDRLV